MPLHSFKALLPVRAAILVATAAVELLAMRLAHDALFAFWARVAGLFGFRPLSCMCAGALRGPRQVQSFDLAVELRVEV